MVVETSTQHVAQTALQSQVIGGHREALGHRLERIELVELLLALCLGDTGRHGVAGACGRRIGWWWVGPLRGRIRSMRLDRVARSQGIPPALFFSVRGQTG